MLDKSIIDKTKTVELPFFVERTCTDCDTNESINLRPESKSSSSLLSSFRSASRVRSLEGGGGGSASRDCLKRGKCYKEKETETGKETALVCRLMPFNALP